MLRQMIEFVQKVPEMKWGEERLKNYLETSKKNFFFAVDANQSLKYQGFSIVGIENPFSKEISSKKFVNLENWMKTNKNLLGYTAFLSYRKPVGSHNSCLGSNSGLGTICLSHFELEKGEKIFKDKKKNVLKDKVEIHKVFKDRVSAHTMAIDDETLREQCVERAKLKNLYTDFFDDLFNNLSEESVKQIFKHEVVIFNDKILGIKAEGKAKKEYDEETLEYPKYFNGQNQKKPFLIESRSRPIKENLLISKDDQKRIHEFIIRILPDIGTPFILPLDEKLQKKMAEDIAYNEKNFFKTVENLLGKKELNSKPIVDRFDFYFVDIRGKKISFFDYVSNYQYYFPERFYEVFPLGRIMDSTSFSRRSLNEKISMIFGQKNLSCLPWVEPPKNMNNSKKSAYVQLLEKMFETIYLGKVVLTEFEIKNLCIMLIEDRIINEKDSKTRGFSNTVLNMYANHHLFTLGGESVGNSLMSKAKEIEERISNNEFKPINKESGFYFLGMLLKRLCDKSETSNEKSRLLQPIINTHTISGLNRVVVEKFVEKYAYKIDEKDIETRELMTKVLPFFAEQDGEELTKDFKLWLYAGFFSNNEGGKNYE